MDRCCPAASLPWSQCQTSVDLPNPPSATICTISMFGLESAPSSWRNRWLRPKNRAGSTGLGTRPTSIFAETLMSLEIMVLARGQLAELRDEDCVHPLSQRPGLVRPEDGGHVEVVATIVVGGLEALEDRDHLSHERGVAAALDRGGRQDVLADSVAEDVVEVALPRVVQRDRAQRLAEGLRRTHGVGEIDREPVGEAVVVQEEPALLRDP